MENLLNWIKAPRHVAWPLVIVSSLLLWGPTWFLSGLGLDAFIEEYRKWLGVVFLFFLAVGLQPLAPKTYEAIKDKILEIKQINNAKRQIANLTPDEKDILRYYIVNNTRTQDLSIQNGNVSALISRGFLIIASQVSYGGHRGSLTFPVNITDWTLKYIRENPQVIENKNA